MEFGEGMTAIIGPNEQGKSLTLEMIEFCLFGTGALRGDADDYKHLQTALVFVVKGARYQVVRSSKNCVIGLAGGEALARGTKPVNALILDLLGFGLDVFRVACAANQGDVERLAQMKPTARREMVDRLIGADRIEQVSDWTAEQALLLKREIDVLERGLVAPEAPEKPEGWQDAKGLAKVMVAKQASRDEAVSLRAWLGTRPVVLAAPEVPPHDFTREVLDQAEELFYYTVYEFDIAEQEALWADWELWNRKQQFLTDHPRPENGVTIAIADAMIEMLNLDADRKRLQKSPKLCCPKCDHTFTLADDEVSQLTKKYDALVEQFGPYRVTEVNWNHQRQLAMDWESRATAQGWEDLCDVPEIEKPRVTMAQITAASTNGISKAALAAQLDELELPGATLQAVRVLRRQLDQFEAAVEAAGPAKAAVAAWDAEEPAKREAMGEAEAAGDGLDEARALLGRIVAYDQALVRHEQAQERYDQAVAEIADKREERQSWLLGKDQLLALRTKLKSYLAPSLSQAASMLLSQMTRGARSAIWVDENFEITVDGQKLQTLSGSGKVCANLALRLGLAQVLTNNVLSVFIGDEMDAYMDPERVAALNESLQRLTGRVKQIIIITHKPPICKQVIDIS